MSRGDAVRTTSDERSIRSLAIQVARAMCGPQRITMRQLDLARIRRRTRPRAPTSSILLLTCIAGEHIASSHKYALDPISPHLDVTEFLSYLEVQIARLVVGETIESNSASDVNVPATATEFISTAVDAVRVERIARQRRE